MRIFDIYSSKEIQDMCGISQAQVSRIKSGVKYNFFSIPQALRIHIKTGLNLNQIEPHYSEIWELIDSISKK